MFFELELQENVIVFYGILPVHKPKNVKEFIK